MADYGLSGILFLETILLPFQLRQIFICESDITQQLSSEVTSKARIQTQNWTEEMFRARTCTLCHFWDLTSHTIRYGLKISRCIDFLSSCDGRPIKLVSFLEPNTKILRLLLMKCDLKPHREFFSWKCQPKHTLTHTLSHRILFTG